MQVEVDSELAELLQKWEVLDLAPSLAKEGFKAVSHLASLSREEGEELAQELKALPFFQRRQLKAMLASLQVSALSVCSPKPFPCVCACVQVRVRVYVCVEGWVGGCVRVCVRECVCLTMGDTRHVCVQQQAEQAHKGSRA